MSEEVIGERKKPSNTGVRNVSLVEVDLRGLGSPMVKTLHSVCRGHGFNSQSKN